MIECFIIREYFDKTNIYEGGNRMGEDMNGYQPPVVEGLDGDDSSGVSTYGTEWVWETYYVTYVNGAVAGDTVIITINI